MAEAEAEAPAGPELTELEAAIEAIATAFVTFTAREGSGGSPTAAELRELLRLQLPNLLKDAPSLEEKLSGLELKEDEELSFGHFWRLLGEVAGSLRGDRAAPE